MPKFSPNTVVVQTTNPLVPNAVISGAQVIVAALAVNSVEAPKYLVKTKDNTYAYVDETTLTSVQVNHPDKKA